MNRLFIIKYPLLAAAILMTSYSVSYSAVNAVTPQQHPVVSQDPSAWKRNPFANGTKQVKPTTPATTAGIGRHTVPEQSFHLQGIMQVNKNYHALVNGMTVKRGDVIGSMTIKEITRYKVVVQNDRKEKITYDIYQGRIDRGSK